MNNLPLESAAFACEGVITAVAVLSQVLQVQRDCPNDPLTPAAVDMLLEAYAVSCTHAGQTAEA
jgi:hypothetical protein